MAKKGQKYQKRSYEERMEIVREYLEEGKSGIYLSKKYGVSRHTIHTWATIYKRDGGLDIQKKGRPREENIDYKERYEILKKFQGFLKEAEQEKK